MNRKVAGAVGVALISIVLAGIFLNQHWRIGTLEAANYDLLLKLEKTTRELMSFQRNWTDSQNNAKANPKPKIVTRLGMKLIDMTGGRFSDNYLWVTGEIHNAGNFTAYNVQLLFKFYTENGAQVKQISLGALKPYEVISIRTALVPEIGTIKNWDIEPVATSEP